MGSSWGVQGPMTYVWIVYKRFIDESPDIKGIFTEHREAIACRNNWDVKSSIVQVELNKEYPDNDLLDLP